MPVYGKTPLLYDTMLMLMCDHKPACLPQVAADLHTLKLP